MKTRDAKTQYEYRHIQQNSPLRAMSRKQILYFSRSEANGPFSCILKGSSHGLARPLTILGVIMGSPSDDPILREVEPEVYWARSADAESRISFKLKLNKLIDLAELSTKDDLEIPHIKLDEILEIIGNQSY